MTATRHNGFFAILVLGVMTAGQAAGADAPTAAQALALTPIQPHVEYTTVSKEEAAECTIRPEKENTVTAWAVRNKNGEILRRFADTNGDNVVDQWCYYQNGLEVYRDIDSNFNGKADQFRWFHTAGMRWGIDKNEDRRIDEWRSISAHEVAEQVVIALKMRDAARFELVLLNQSELADAGLGKTRTDAIGEKIKAAPGAFAKLLSEQRVITPKSRYVDFGSARPALIPVHTAGSTKDAIVLENASALVETDGKHEQVLLGTLINIGDTWKLIDVPVIGANGQPQEGGFLEAPLVAANALTPSPNAPSDAMQKLLSQLEQLDRLADTLPAEKQAAAIAQRADLLKQLAEMSPEADREQWYRQLTGVVSVGIQSGTFPQGVERLNQLQQSLTDAKANADLIAYVAFQRMWAEYVASQSQPNADQALIQNKWLADLQAFVEQYPKSPESAEALLQLGMYQDFVGKAEEASKWYQQLVTSFPKSDPAVKATGALRRLNAKGKPMQLRGTSIDGRGTIDLSQARGKVVLIHYWASWCGDACKAEMLLLKELFAKRDGRQFDIIGVCLDEKAEAGRAYLAQVGLPWKHIHEGGLDSRLANEMGIMTLPLMILVDQSGNVVSANIHAGGELEAELNRLIPPSTGTANTDRNTRRQ